MPQHLYQRSNHRSGYGARRIFSARRDRVREDGFTMLEVVVSIAIFMTVGVAIVACVIAGVNAADRSSNRVGASNIAQSDLEQARSEPTPSPTTYTTTPPSGGGSYSVKRTVAIPSPCTIGSDIPVAVTVKGPGTSKDSVTMSTVLACGNP